MDIHVAETIQICSKCCRKLGDEGRALRKAVKAAVKNAADDQVSVEKTDCFSLCPKGGQVIAAFSKKSARRVVIVQPDSDVKAAVKYLLGTTDTDAPELNHM